jgi:hypothetical protein
VLPYGWSPVGASSAIGDLSIPFKRTGFGSPPLKAGALALFLRGFVSAATYQ